MRFCCQGVGVRFSPFASGRSMPRCYCEKCGAYVGRATVQMVHEAMQKSEGLPSQLSFARTLLGDEALARSQR